MRVLIFHGRLSHLTGGEVNTRDWALGLKARGHKIVVFTVCPGPLAEQIRNCGIAVVEDPSSVSDVPDIIFGAGVNDVVAVLARFPDVPAVQVAQVWDHWNAYPCALPQVVLHVAVDELNAEMLTNEFGVPRERVRIVHNSVNLAQIPGRKNALPKLPLRAAIIVKEQSDYVETVRAACALRNISVDSFGYPTGRPLENPFSTMVDYDLVIGSARIALEGAAAGAAVVVADHRGLAGMLTTKNLSRFRDNNFGRELLTCPVELGRLTSEIDLYDAVDAASVSKAIRERATLDRQLDHLELIFAEAIDRFKRTPPTTEAIRKSLSAYLAAHLPRPAEAEPSPRHLRFHQAGASLAERISATESQLANLKDQMSSVSTPSQEGLSLATASLAERISATEGQLAVVKDQLSLLTQSEQTLSAATVHLAEHQQEVANLRDDLMHIDRGLSSSMLGLTAHQEELARLRAAVASLEEIATFVEGNRVLIRLLRPFAVGLRLFARRRHFRDYDFRSPGRPAPYR